MNSVVGHQRSTVCVALVIEHSCADLHITQMAIASAVLQHLVNETNCKTLFITHYPLVANEIEKQYPDKVQNLHMGYIAESRVDGTREITFLYHLTRGVATGNFFHFEAADAMSEPQHIPRFFWSRMRKIGRNA